MLRQRGLFLSPTNYWSLPTKKILMVDRAIKVALLEGDFAAICDLGLPFSLSLQLQSFGLKLSEAMWTAKSSSFGFSVSIFWPSDVMSERMKTKKKRRHRKRPKASKTNTVTDVTTPPVSTNEFSSCGNADVQLNVTTPGNTSACKCTITNTI